MILKKKLKMKLDIADEIIDKEEFKIFMITLANSNS